MRYSTARSPGRGWSGRCGRLSEERGADFLLRRAAAELADRLSLVKRDFAVAVDLGTPGPHAAEMLAGDRRIGFVVRAAPT